MQGWLTAAMSAAIVAALAPSLCDPTAYTRPFAVRIRQRIVADGSEPIEFVCHENQTFLKLTGRAQNRPR